jgi:HPr kinase/phosphorylase
MNTDSQVINLHGTAVLIDNLGVLICGESGSGKTDLALELISRGHKFIADDVVVIKKTDDNQLLMTADTNNINFAHLRGVGFIDVSKCFTKNSTVINYQSNLSLIIRLTNSESANLTTINLEPLNTEIMGVKVPTTALVTTRYRNLALVSELIVKNFILVKNGYNANNVFLEKFSQITE